MDVPKLIRDARRSAEISQRQLAERAGISRHALSHYESGRRTPTLATLRTVLAAAGKQIHAELAPLDADIKRAIAEISERPVDERPGVRVWCCLGDQVTAFNHRVEGLAAASILGAPVPVDTFDIALADEERTFEWLSSIMMQWVGRIRLPEWPHHRVIRLPAAQLRSGLQQECPEGRFELRYAAFDGAARLAPPEEVARHVTVSTGCGVVPVQPLHEIEAADPRAARMLDVLREQEPGDGTAPPGTAMSLARDLRRNRIIPDDLLR